MSGSRIPQMHEYRRERAAQRSPARIRKTRPHVIDIDQLRLACSSHSPKLSCDEWLKWLSRLRTQFVRQSPSASIRGCANMADEHEPWARSLFNAAFLSVWTEIGDSERKELSSQLVDVLTSCPYAEPIEAILNLVEFMEHSEKGPLPITHGTLSRCAERACAYAKAIRYKELEVIGARHEVPNVEDCQALIRFATKLNVTEYAAGVVQYAEQMGLDITGYRFVNLTQWGKASNSNDDLQEQENVEDTKLSDSSPSLGLLDDQSAVVKESKLSKEDLVLYQLNCLELLGKWDDLLAAGSKVRLEVDLRGSVAGDQSMGAIRCGIRLGNELSSQCPVIPCLPSTSHLASAWSHTEKRRRSAPMMMRSTCLPGSSKCARESSESAILHAVQAHSLVQTMIATLSDATAAHKPSTTAASDHFTVPMTAATSFNLATNGVLLSEHPKSISTRHQRGHLGQPKSYAQILERSEQHTSIIMRCYANVTKFDPNWHKAWHRLATTYYDMAMAGHRMPIAACHSTRLVNQTDSKPLPVSRPTRDHAAQAVRYFIKALQLADGSRLDDTLRLLTLWFDYGERSDVCEVLQDSLRLVPMDSWLEVMPQLIARLDCHQRIGSLVKQLVVDISSAHPQAVIYALTAAAKSHNADRARVAREILDIMAETRPILVKQAQMLNDELIRSAILWPEQWYNALDDASQFYYQTMKGLKIENMMDILRPLHSRLHRGHETPMEQSFIQAYYKEINDAFSHCESFQRTNRVDEMQTAWQQFFTVFKRISDQLRTMAQLDLNDVSPRLAAARNLDLTVPGTYDLNGAPIKIVSVHHQLQIIASKHRPRKIYVIGSDGIDYAFLLKGHEDPRQDQRVMQLFGLLNTLMLRDPDTCRRKISIERYSVTTLSQTSGLIGWLPNCDTLHSLIKDYREKRGINLSDEHMKMQSTVVNIDKATLMQKVEAFETMLAATNGDDLRQTLWTKSLNSEMWFERRTNYTRSMACMSMMGYVLGLGDRHPSNLMMDRMSGKIVHIDFGDCFEVAMIREKYPERIPFRLTRMLIRAMEVTGIEGNFRLTCERVLHLLRNSSDSILAVLETFVYDPIINWRLAESRRIRHTVNVDDDMRGAEGADQYTGNAAINRVKTKLCGRDFDDSSEVSICEQVSRLIDEATSSENLCQLYVGWCPFW